MSERVPQAQQFSSPEEEIAYLRKKIAEKERGSQGREASVSDYETLAQHELKEYSERPPASVLKKQYEIREPELSSAVKEIGHAEDQVQNLLGLAKEKGIRNIFTVLEKLNDAFVTDEIHRALVREIKSGIRVAGVKEGMPVWNVLHMTLFEVALPERGETEKQETLKELISSMEQFYAGMQSITTADKHNYFTLEVAVSDNSDEIIFYAAVPTSQMDLFEKQLLSLFPDAVITEQQNDYNIFVEGGISLASVAKLDKHPVYPLRIYDSFDHDPLNVLLNTFSKIEREGGGGAVQIIFKPSDRNYKGMFEKIITRVRDGMKVQKAVNLATLGGAALESLKEIVEKSPKKDNKPLKTSEVDNDALEQFQTKVDRPIVAANIRVVTSAKSEPRARQILTEIESSFNQLENTKGNKLIFTRLKGSALSRCLKSFSFREYIAKNELPLSIAELTSLIHFPAEGIQSSPQFKQSRAKTAAAPTEMPSEGTLLGTNDYRNTQKDIYVTPEDRLRHFYIIGQTGTGKTTLMKNMIIQDIEAGNGVCMIDPHGTDIEDVLGAVPPEREEDIIYFDPSHTERVMGLNMLEFDETHPEQKTFVVNELFSIFQKLYGKVPESMGPMFEQYFRNATMLVLEDPESGSTLMDISRVMADATYRRKKLRKAINPVVTQFWQDIATKAGGEAALENIVPYITSKFDVFTANDFMRPIVGQQKSSFDFRHVMDERKILLVNLAKGRLGEINANLIGMVIVGKILMAALSRVDDPTKNFPPFYLHMDEFQNVTTDSIAAILSEARKYKLGLTLAHQFIAQLEEDIRDAVFGNVGSIAAFRVGPEDAEFLEKQYEPVFTANDLMNIENRNAYVRILAEGTPTKPFNITTRAPREVDLSKIERLKHESFKRYGSYKVKVEMEIAARYQ